MCCTGADLSAANPSVPLLPHGHAHVSHVLGLHLRFCGRDDVERGAGKCERLYWACQEQGWEQGRVREGLSD